jgi:DNA modification methylase
MGTFYMNCFEYILFLWKGFAKKINNCGTPDILSFYNTKDKNADGSNIHDSQKPIGLMQTLIVNSTNENEVVLDPFMGSGTTALAAIRSNSRYIGFEIDKTYYDLTQKRLAQEISQPTLF